MKEETTRAIGIIAIIIGFFVMGFGGIFIGIRLVPPVEVENTVYERAYESKEMKRCEAKGGRYNVIASIFDEGEYIIYCKIPEKELFRYRTDSDGKIRY